jgi:hypothetical protein
VSAAKLDYAWYKSVLSVLLQIVSFILFRKWRGSTVTASALCLQSRLHRKIFDLLTTITYLSKRP